MDTDSFNKSMYHQLTTLELTNRFVFIHLFLQRGSNVKPMGETSGSLAAIGK